MSVKTERWIETLWIDFLHIMSSDMLMEKYHRKLSATTKGRLPASCITLKLVICTPSER
ncbi:MAG: hypothetical protein PHH86_09020 [Sphaerochaetaceae bacterium]|nr:hypothetical protein [Sphaerochaetaceae bacterium]